MENTKLLVCLERFGTLSNIVALHIISPSEPTKSYNSAHFSNAMSASAAESRENVLETAPQGHGSVSALASGGRSHVNKHNFLYSRSQGPSQIAEKEWGRENNINLNLILMDYSAHLRSLYTEKGRLK